MAVGNTLVIVRTEHIDVSNIDEIFGVDGVMDFLLDRMI